MIVLVIFSTIVSKSGNTNNIISQAIALRKKYQISVTAITIVFQNMSDLNGCIAMPCLEDIIR